MFEILNYIFNSVRQPYPGTGHRPEVDIQILLLGGLRIHPLPAPTKTVYIFDVCIIFYGFILTLCLWIFNISSCKLASSAKTLDTYSVGKVRSIRFLKFLW
jgi:hypothetical protein